MKKRIKEIGKEIEELVTKGPDLIKKDIVL